jgi:hypothetical protein
MLQLTAVSKSETLNFSDFKNTEILGYLTVQSKVTKIACEGKWIHLKFYFYKFLCSAAAVVVVGIHILKNYY